MLLSLEKRDAVSVGQDFSHYICQLVSAGTWQVWHPTQPLPPVVRLLHRDFRIEYSLTAPPACRGLGQSILLTTWSSFLLLFFIRTWFSTKRGFNTTGEKQSQFKMKFVGRWLQRDASPHQAWEIPTVSKDGSPPTFPSTQGLQHRRQASSSQETARQL